MKPFGRFKLLRRLTKMQTGIELTLVGHCEVRCTKHCPWEVFQCRYGNPDEMMTMDTLKKILANIPKGSFIKFAGFSEPLTNQDCIDMMQYAIDMGFKVKLFTTLYGLKEEDIEKLCNLKLYDVCLHVPDPNGVVKHPGYPWYNDAVMRIVQSQPRVYFSIMNDMFVTCHREDFIRGKKSKRWILPRFCYKWIIPTPIIMPNGDTYFCCMDFGLNYYMGNILSEDYWSLVKKSKIPTKMCKQCYEGISLKQAIKRILL